MQAVICGVKLRQVPPLVYGSPTETFQLDLDEKVRIVNEMGRETFAESMCLQEDTYRLSDNEDNRYAIERSDCDRHATDRQEAPLEHPRYDVVSQKTMGHENEKNRV